MGFVQIAMDFGCTPAEEKASPAQAEKSASSNGNGHAQQEETRAEASKAPAHRRLAPPPPDKILVEEPEPVAEISLPEEEHVSIEEPFFPEEETRAADVPAEQMEQPAPSLAEITLEMAEKEENALVENRIPEEDEETDSDDDSPIEFELEPELQHEEDSIEGQVSIAYFQKADASEEDGEVFEIPMFSQPSTGPDSKPVVIVRVKEKKETGAGTGKNKRGRKSIRDMMAEAEMVEIPEDEILFKKQYYGIGEVAKMFGVNTSLIRFWETEFDIIKPKKNRKGDRLFRPIDVKNLHLIHNLLRLKKFTIEGAKDFLKNNRKKAEKNFEIEQSLKRIKGFLLQMKADVSLT